MTICCRICNSHTELHEFSEFKDFIRVTSDSKAWRKGGRLVICKLCGAVQKPGDAIWKQECSEIYTKYDIYHQSGGVEAQYFCDNSAASTNRSVRVIEALTFHTKLPKSGMLLDFGCGNGAFLKIASRSLPNWKLYGSEVNDKYRAEVLSIDQVAAFSSGDLNAIPNSLDAITLIHVLEHIDKPADLLRSLAAKLSNTGLLLVEVPNFLDNPFDLLIADHSTHFSLPVLKSLLKLCGFNIEYESSTWIAKENTVLARSENLDSTPISIASHTSNASSAVAAALSWLSQVKQSAIAACSTSKKLGIFGTSNAARWIDAELGGRAAFFVDEDQNRVGRSLEGRPIYSPDQVPTNSTVLLPLAPVQADAVYPRLMNKCRQINWFKLGNPV